MRQIFIFIMVAAGFQSIQATEEKLDVQPLLKLDKQWKLGKSWGTKTIGQRDFYLATAGNYYHWDDSYDNPYYQTGLLRHFIPGHWRLAPFNPDIKEPNTGNLKAVERFAKQEKMVNQFLTNHWPLQTTDYIGLTNKPVPSEATFKRVWDIWFGEGHPEVPIYRIEPIFHFLGTIKWDGYQGFFGNMYPKFADFMKNDVIPAIKQKVPAAADPKHHWSKTELMTAASIYANKYADISRRIYVYPWFADAYGLAKRPEIIAVGQKNCGNNLADMRGVARQSGKKMFQVVTMGHEVPEKWSGLRSELANSPERDDQGLAFSLAKYHVWKPFLYGANYYYGERFPQVLVWDNDGDGRYELSTLGRVAMDLIDYTERHPDRGVYYAPVAVAYGFGNKPLRGSQAVLERGDGYLASAALVNKIISDRRNGSSLRANGEIYDVLMPDPDSVDADVFDGYKMVFALPGQTITDHYAKVLKRYVQGGGVLVVNAADAVGKFTPEFLGGELTGDTSPGDAVTTPDGETIEEVPFDFAVFKPTTAQTLYRCGERPVVTVNQNGGGRVVLVMPLNMLSAKEKVVRDNLGLTKRRKELLNFTDGFLLRLFAGLTPFTLRVDPRHVGDFKWFIQRRGDGWAVTVLCENVERELRYRYLRTMAGLYLYPYKSIPFTLTCHDPKMKDVMECYEDRDVDCERLEEEFVINESIRGGDVRVYEFQPRRIEPLKRKRFINLALNKPVKATSTHGSKYAPELAVDGDRGRRSFWASEYVDAKHGYRLPQTLEVDLERIEAITHFFVLFHTWEQRHVDLRQIIYKYSIDVSKDGKYWETVVDETGNATPAHPEGREFWIEPTRARYVRLTVKYNSAFSGARVCEFQVMGNRQESFQPKRRKLVRYGVDFPKWVDEIPADKIVHLYDLEPTSVKHGWIWFGKTWKDMNGVIPLYSDFEDVDGTKLDKSLYAHAPSELVYAIPEDAARFVSAAGFANKAEYSSAIFKVYVDDELKYDSGLHKCGMGVRGVVVDVKGGDTLRLVVEDGGDGVRSDYAWWGEPRFIRQ